ncbi:MAG: TetR/AcrR family transcriptional regulator [Candidatus Kapabacteria bacterium]|jgi:AcrR family transcriptional regulator|nr:TetR/AcrR family transcriptional regulator [Candidatus Kapabacteria bacterium]
MIALSTFTNLPPERQEAVVMAAAEEFAMKDYESASLSEIVKKLGIAKGSFYRYFDSKLSLYRYTLNYALQLRLQHEGKVLQKPLNDFFELLVENFQEKLAFDLKYPLFAALSYKVLQEQHEDVRETQHELKNQILELLVTMLKEQQRRGIVRKNIDIRLMAFSIFTLQAGMYDFLAYRFGIDIRANIRERKPMLELSNKDVRKVAKEMAEMLKNGIKSS